MKQEKHDSDCRCGDCLGRRLDAVEPLVSAAKEWWRHLPEMTLGNPSKERIQSAHELCKAVEALIKAEHGAPSAEEVRKVTEYERQCPSRDSNGVLCEREYGHEGRHACPEAMQSFIDRAGTKWDRSILGAPPSTEEKRPAIVDHAYGLLKEALSQVVLNSTNPESLESAHDLALAASQVLSLCARLAAKPKLESASEALYRAGLSRPESF